MSLRISAKKGDAAGLGNLIEAFAAQKRREIDEAFREQAGLLRDDIIKGWPVDTYASRAGWQGPTKIGEADYQLKNDYPYAATIEYGGYPGVGPKTHEVGAFVLPEAIQVNGGIYPTQRPAAPVRQALSKRKVELKRMFDEQG